MISSSVRLTQKEPPFPENKKSETVFAVENDSFSTDKKIRIAFQEFAPLDNKIENQTPIFLIHGSPGDSGNLEDLGRELNKTGRRVIIPDLPGFGDSTRKIPDYSFRAHAFYVKELAEALKIEKFHALGFSMGGGVVLNLNEIAPEKLKSISLISAIGVQEYELLGDHRLNRILHGAQFTLFWSIENLFPHFGYLDNSFLGLSYARNFYDSDQRPLRSILEKTEQPVLIIHGVNDSLVQIQAAREHARIVPQSEFREFDDDHFMIFERPLKIAPLISDFLDRTEIGTAQTRKNADAERLKNAFAPFVREVMMANGATVIVFFLILALSTFISEDLTLLSAGALAGQGQISLSLAVFACFVGIFVGDMLLYLAGRIFGRRAVHRRPLSWFVSESAIEHATNWLVKNGLRTVFFSRITPGLRLPIYFSAGVLKTDFLSFVLFFALAAAVWTPLVVVPTAWLSESATGIMNGEVQTLSREFWLIIAAIVISGFVFLNLLMRLATWRGQRLLVGTFLRYKNWEFWSLKTFYLPIVIYILWLMLKYKSVSVFADANPAIEAGGFVGESKKEIYDGLRRSKAAAQHLLKYKFIAVNLDSTEKIKLASEFIDENNLTFPIALKPNAGERGAGVFLVKTEEELNRRLNESKTDLILQELADGEEFGVFYYRFPNEEKGKIFAITEKRFPFVIGDGAVTLETLILRDKRAVALADAYFERNAEQLDFIPSKGEKVQLIDIGTHSKGAVFLDGGWALTETLENEIDLICRNYEGFYFGRFDLRSPSPEAFQNGEFKIIELNGVTSEATSIYDPKNSLFNAYKILFRQWHIAFEIGAQNRARGARKTSAFQLAKLIYESKFGIVHQKLKVPNLPQDVSDSSRV